MWIGNFRLFLSHVLIEAKYERSYHFRLFSLRYKHLFISTIISPFYFCNFLNTWGWKLADLILENTFFSLCTCFFFQYDFSLLQSIKLAQSNSLTISVCHYWTDCRFIRTYLRKLLVDNIIIRRFIAIDMTWVYDNGGHVPSRITLGNF